MYDFGVIGNCQVSALVGKDGAVKWLCFPRPDSPPVFGSLLDSAGGYLCTAPLNCRSSRQYYFKNTNILQTEFDCAEEGGVVITDFCPRFEQHGRMYRPTSMFRIITPKYGNPRVKIGCRPVNGWTKELVPAVRANSHLRFEFPHGLLRVVTNAPLTYLIEEEPFLLQEPVYIAVMWDSPMEADLKQVSLDFLDRTQNYWQRWVKHCSIPTLFQEEVIRSALALKLHCYEDTGAIIAATTTSLPEQIGKERNWDYRFCWLRDTFFTLNAFYHLGHFEEMEGFLRFILNIVNYSDDLLPVYSLDHKPPLPEELHTNWSGFFGSTPVRSKNAAALQIQNDVYGELILTLAPIYLDERFHHLRSEQLNKTMQWLAKRSCYYVGKPDAGLWELRGSSLEHSFTNLMCWAGIDRTIKMMNAGKLVLKDQDFGESLVKARMLAESRIQAATNEHLVVTNSPGDSTLDASLLLMSILRFPNLQACRNTTEAIAKELRMRPASVGDLEEFLLFRYKRSDDFGAPEDPFVFCSFWLAQAYARLGDRQRGIRILESLRTCGNHLGLYAEHYSPADNRQLGNFPQAYSHVGMVNAAFDVSPSWMEIL
jgi:GH15 family glucan-1,4-alpha-glucosidase